MSQESRLRYIVAIVTFQEQDAQLEKSSWLLPFCPCVQVGVEVQPVVTALGGTGGTARSGERAVSADDQDHQEFVVFVESLHCSML